MVGVPGRSKGCNTCRKRKIACSLEKPQCQICVKANRICGGYERHTIFVVGQGAKYEGPKDGKPKSKSTVNKRQSLRGYGQCDYFAMKLGSEVARTLSRPTLNSTSPSTRSTYFDQFLAQYLYYTVPHPYSTDWSQTNGNWLTMLPFTPLRSAALETSVLAVSTAKVGRMNNDPVLLQQGFKLYTQGLRELQRALWDPKLMYMDETVAACIALILYEVTECPNKKLDDWISHMRGCSKLVELKGSNSFSSDFGHSIFLSFRLAEIQQALAERRSTYLANDEWLHQPFEARVKSNFHQFLDIMVQVPTIIGDGYRMLQGPLEGTMEMDPVFMLLTLLDLIDRCWKVDSKLQKIYEKIERENSGPLYWSQSPRIESEDPNDGHVFAVSFKFSNLDTTHTCILYWATSIIMWSGMTYAYQLLATFQAMFSAIQAATANSEDSVQSNILSQLPNLPPLEHRSNPSVLAKNICRSIDYCLEDEHLGMGARIASFPLKVAIETLNDAPDCDLELAWAHDAMERIKVSGVKIMGHLSVPMTDHSFLPG